MTPRRIEYNRPDLTVVVGFSVDPSIIAIAKRAVDFFNRAADTWTSPVTGAGLQAFIGRTSR